MAMPTRQQLDILSLTAKAAAEGRTAFGDILTFLARLQDSPSVAGIAAADFSDPKAAGTFVGFDPAKFANWQTAAAALLTFLGTPLPGKDYTPRQAFAAMAEMAS